MILKSIIKREEILEHSIDEALSRRINIEVNKVYPLEKYSLNTINFRYDIVFALDAMEFMIEINFPIQREWNF